MKLLTTLFSTILMTGSLALAIPAIADEHGMSSMHGMMHGGGPGKYGMHHEAGNWKATLTAEQQQQISKLKLDFKKKVLPIKAKIKQAKIELAMLITSDKPDQKAIDKKIDEILKLKGEKMRAKARHKVEVRKVLNEQQRVAFDLHMLTKASRDKQGAHHQGHHN